MSRTLRRIARQPARVLLIGFCILVGTLLAAPMFVVIPMSFTETTSFRFPPDGWSLQWYDNLISDRDWYESLLSSLEVAALSTALSVCLGTAAALSLVRGRIPGKALISGALLSPMIVPIVMIAIATYAVFLKWRLTGTLWGFVCAHTALATPYVVVAVSASLRTFDRRLEMAAASLGAGPVRTFTRITLPLIAPGILAGTLFAFVTSFDELVIALFLVSPDMRTLPVQMFTSVFERSDPTVAAASSVLLMATFILLLPLVFWRGRTERR